MTTRTRTPTASPLGDRWHVITTAAPNTTRCGLAVIPGAEQTPARTVETDLRCQAPGCRRAWPAPLRAVS